MEPEVIEMCEEEKMENEMKNILGFTKFSSTKGKKVPGNFGVSVKINAKTTFRQYMNRKGGFNRPLDPVAK